MTSLAFQTYATHWHRRIKFLRFITVQDSTYIEKNLHDHMNPSYICKTWNLHYSRKNSSFIFLKKMNSHGNVKNISLEHRYYRTVMSRMVLPDTSSLPVAISIFVLCYVCNDNYCRNEEAISSRE